MLWLKFYRQVNKKELINKYEVYEEAGVKEYWIVSISDKPFSGIYPMKRVNFSLQNYLLKAKRYSPAFYPALPLCSMKFLKINSLHKKSPGCIPELSISYLSIS